MKKEKKKTIKPSNICPGLAIQYFQISKKERKNYGFFFFFSSISILKG